MTKLHESVGALVIVRCWCGIQHAVPESLRNEQLRHRDEGMPPMSVYCPLGHAYSLLGESLAAKHAREIAAKEKAIAAERARHDQTKAALAAEKRTAAAHKGAATRLKNRAAAGVCPCCNRTFKQLAAHMKTKHPEYAAKDHSSLH